MNRANDVEISKKAMEFVTDFTAAIDIGAHSGRWINYLTPYFGHVHAFEPSRELYEKYLTPLFAKNPKLIFINKYAILDWNGYGELVYPPNTRKLHAGFVRRCDDNEFVSEVVPVTMLDNKKFDSCGLLKLDIEGGELLALRGGERLINKFKPVIVVECKTRTAARYGWTPKELDNWLFNREYRLQFSAYPNLVYKNII